MQEFSARLLVISNTSNFIEIAPAKALKVLRFSEPYLEFMPASISSTTASKGEALAQQDLFLASLHALIVWYFSNSIFCVLSKDMSSTGAEASYLLLLFKALTPSSAPSSSTKIGLFITWYWGNSLGNKDTPVLMTRITSWNMTPSNMLGGSKVGQIILYWHRYSNRVKGPWLTLTLTLPWPKGS